MIYWHLSLPWYPSCIANLLGHHHSAILVMLIINSIREALTHYSPWFEFFISFSWLLRNSRGFSTLFPPKMKILLINLTRIWNVSSYFVSQAIIHRFTNWLPCSIFDQDKVDSLRWVNLPKFFLQYMIWNKGQTLNSIWFVLKTIQKSNFNRLKVAHKKVREIDPP